MTSEVHFTSVTSSASELQPGLYGIAVDAVLQNDLDTPITGVEANLNFGGGRGSQFYYRDVDRRDGSGAVPQPTMVAAHASATFHFIVDAQSNCVPPGPVPVNGAATFFDGTATMSATPLATPPELPFAALNPPIVVDTATDENTANTTTSLREAIALAIHVVVHVARVAGQRRVTQVLRLRAFDGQADAFRLEPYVPEQDAREESFA